MGRRPKSLETKRQQEAARRLLASSQSYARLRPERRHPRIAPGVPEPQAEQRG